MTEARVTSSEDLELFAFGKLSRVLGASARRVYDEALREAGLERLRTPDDLYAFAAKLSARGGFEGAVGGLLSVAAVMRGASPSSR